MVELILKENEKLKGNILDIGTGSGCIALALAKFLPESRVEGWDISVEALNIATQNARQNSIETSFSKKDILNLNTSEISRQYDLIVKKWIEMFWIMNRTSPYL